MNIIKQVRIGIIGIGNMGSAHATAIADKNIKGLTLTAVCDTDPQKRLWAKEHLPGIEFFDTAGALINSDTIDAVLISTPHYLHPEMAIAAFSKKLHVLTEKPAGVFLRTVKEMNKAADKAGVVFGIMWNQRTNPLFQKARELVQSGRIGNLKRLVWIITNWYRTQAYYDSGSWRATWSGEGGGVLLNQAPHNLDLWQWIFGMPKRIRAFCYPGKYHSIEVEDDATIYAEYESGAVATFITSTGEYPGTNRLEITGDRGKMVLEDGALKLWELDVFEREACFTEEKGFPEWNVTEHIITPEGTESAHAGILQNFTDAIIHGTPLLAPGKDGINELAISNAAYLSSWTDSWVDIPFNEALFEELLCKHIRESNQSPPTSNSKDEINKGRYNKRWNVHW